ncbi:MAG: antibiotic biosynthesis monooxygenase [Paracoccaceae bacterium]
MTEGRLAIWNDCAPGHEAAYETWYQGEHLLERLGIPGFLRGRRYQSVAGTTAYFTYYEVSEPGVLTSPAYLARVNDPTPMTRHIMTGTFLNMSRTICRVAERKGRIRGAFAVTRAGALHQDLTHLLDRIPDNPAFARAELWEGVSDDTAGNAEQALRGPDQTVPGCLFAEFLDENTAMAFTNQLELQMSAPVGVYRLMCELQA